MAIKLIIGEAANYSSINILPCDSKCKLWAILAFVMLMIKKLLLSLLLFVTTFATAETIKTDVLVIGAGPGGIACAVQCAHSKIKTLLICPDTALGRFPSTEKTYAIETGRFIPSGLWGDFRQLIRNYYKNQKDYDTTYNAVLKFDPAAGRAAFKEMSDTLKKLTIKLNTPVISIKKDGTEWEAEIMLNGEKVTVKAKVLVDATKDGDMLKKLNVQMPDRFDNTKNYGLNSYRTSIAAGEGLAGQQAGANNLYPPFPAYCLPMRLMVVPGMDNLIVVDRILPETNSIQYLPAQMIAGQGAGTIAAYCAFFKTTTKHLNVRIIQGELLDYRGYLLPFTDIPQKNLHFRAVQQVCATGLLQGEIDSKNGSSEFHFRPDDVVKTAEVKPVLSDIYTRAFLWFDKEKPGEQFTLGNLLSLISDYTLTDPKTLQIALQKAWSAKFKLTGDFDLKRPVTRLEFAVLANRYLNPFARTVDLSGRLIN